MKKRNGFTLIELLAIIVILAIIAVITVPIILNIIETARQGANKNSVTGYGKAVELAFTEYEYATQLGGEGAYEEEYNTGDKDPLKIKIVDSEDELTAEDATSKEVTLYVNYEGDDVNCKQESSHIVAGRLTLKECSVNNDKTNTNYDYIDGQAVKNES